MLVLNTQQHGGKPMVMEDQILALYCRIDDAMKDIAPHPQAKLWPSEIVTLAVLFAIKGKSQRAFYRWLDGNWRHLFPNLPERTRLFRLFATHRDWVERFLAGPTLFGVADTFGIELIHPVREGRSKQQIGKKGLSNKRWIVGGKLGFVLNSAGRVCGWDCATANTHDSNFRSLIEPFDEQMIVLTDSGFHGASGDPANMKVCPPRTWNCRMLVETVLSMLTVVCDIKRMRHRVWRYFAMHLGWTVAAFNLMLDVVADQPHNNARPVFSIADYVL
jgi:hypothetical protein